MTPEQMKMDPIKPIIKVKTNEELETEKGESTKVQDEFTTSEEEEEYSTSSDISKQDSEFDINVDDNQDEQNTQTPETLQNNITMHDKDDVIYDEYDTSEDENKTEIETFEHYGENIHQTEELKPTETSQVLTVFNRAIHHEDDSSDELKLIHQKRMGSKKLENRTNSLLPKFKLKLKTEKLKGS